MNKVQSILEKIKLAKSKTKNENKLNKFQKNINYYFKDINLLESSFMHRSYVNDKKNTGIHIESNERLEFLGDAVLEIVVSDYLYKKYTKLPEGKLTKMRSNAVCEKTLARLAKKINLGDCIYLAKGENMGGGRNKASILSDAFEALIGAIYLDGGMKNVQGFIINNVIEKVDFNYLLNDDKSRLQETLQKNSKKKIHYKIVKEIGPAHDRKFVSQVIHGDKVIGMGEGKSKKEAEQAAAKDALKNMKVLEEKNI